MKQTLRIGTPLLLDILKGHFTPARLNEYPGVIIPDSARIVEGHYTAYGMSGVLELILEWQEQAGNEQPQPITSNTI